MHKDRPSVCFVPQRLTRNDASAAPVCLSAGQGKARHMQSTTWNTYHQQHPPPLHYSPVLSIPSHSSFAACCVHSFPHPCCIFDFSLSMRLGAP